MAKSRKGRWRWIVPLGLLALIALPFFGVRHIKKESDQAWQEFLEKWEAQGEKFELSHYLPSPIADADNLARHPVLTPFLELDEAEQVAMGPDKLPGWDLTAYLNYRGDLSDGKDTTIFPSFGLLPTTAEAFHTHLGDTYLQWSNSLTPLAQAAREREHLWYELDWSRVFIDVEMPSFSAYYHLGRALLARAAIRRGLNDRAGVLRDLDTTLRLSRAYADVPLLITLVYQASLNIAVLDELRACLRNELFDAAQLGTLAESLARTPPLPARFLDALRMERALILAFFRAAEISNDSDLLMGFSDEHSGPIRKKLSKAWMNANRLALCEDQQVHFLGAGATIADLARWEAAINDRLDDRGSRFVAPLGHFALANFGIGGGLGSVLFSSEADLQRARIAVALERFRLAEGAFPSGLNNLVPVYLPAIPVLDPGFTIDYVPLPDQSWRLRLTLAGETPDDWTNK